MWFFGNLPGARSAMARNHQVAEKPVPTDAEALLRFSPFDFGAKADGVTDDTAACNAAAAKAQSVGGTLVIPRGTFAISGFIVIRNGVRQVLGQGGTIRCVNTGKDAGVLLAGRTSGQKDNVKHCRVQGLIIDCGGVTDAATVGIYGQNTSYCEIVGNRIENLRRGHGVLIRSFANGDEASVGNIVRGNEIVADTSPEAKCMGISLDATLDEDEVKSGGAPYVWRRYQRAHSSKLPTRGHTVEDNIVTGGYYGIALSAARDCVVRGNVLSTNVRNISVQNGCTNNRIENNQCRDSLSSGIHLAYGSSNNRIVGNHMRTSRARGEGLLQAYVGSDRNQFVDNTVEAIAPAIPKYFLYTGVHSDDNHFINNRLAGLCSRAYIAVESAFNPKSNDPAHYNYQQGGEGHYATRGMSGVLITGNSLLVDSNVAVIVLAQISDDRGAYSLTHCVVERNHVRWRDDLRFSAPYLKIVEDTPGELRDITFSHNRWPVAPDRNRFVLPRGTAHFSAMVDNAGIAPKS
jgi:parallel beta-helix repeat protein